MDWASELEGIIDRNELEQCRALTNEEAILEIRRTELMVDEKHVSGEITDEDAWDVYFCLMHECHMRGLSSDFRRLREKIDTNLYNPFGSPHDCVRYLARIRLAMVKEIEERPVQ